MSGFVNAMPCSVSRGYKLSLRAALSVRCLDTNFAALRSMVARASSGRLRHIFRLAIRLKPLYRCLVRLTYFCTS